MVEFFLLIDWILHNVKQRVHFKHDTEIKPNPEVFSVKTNRFSLNFCNAFSFVAADSS